MALAEIAAALAPSHFKNLETELASSGSSVQLSVDHDSNSPSATGSFIRKHHLNTFGNLFTIADPVGSM